MILCMALQCCLHLGNIHRYMGMVRSQPQVLSLDLVDFPKCLPKTPCGSPAECPETFVVLVGLQQRSPLTIGEGQPISEEGCLLPKKHELLDGLGWLSVRTRDLFEVYNDATHRPI